MISNTHDIFMCCRKRLTDYSMFFLKHGNYNSAFWFVILRHENVKNVLLIFRNEQSMKIIFMLIVNKGIKKIDLNYLIQL